MTAGWALIKRSYRAFANQSRLIHEQSLFKVTFVLFFAVILFVGLLLLFLEGFDFLRALGGVGLIVINHLFALFFFGLAAMLVFSSVITSYSTIFRSEEVPFLLTRPVSANALMLYKFFESALLSSWAFFFMILPFLGAYAIHEKLSWTFGAWILLYSLPFVFLCAAVGSILCTLGLSLIPGRRSILILLVAFVGVVLAYIGYVVTTTGVATESDATLVLAKLIPALRLVSHPLWPSWWMAEGLMAVARGDEMRGGLLLGVLVTNAILAGLIVESLGGRLFYHAWQKSSVSRNRSQRRLLFLQQIRSRLTPFGFDVRALILKDVRTFFRDPLQWSQMAIFFGLLALYFVNLRNFHYHLLPPEWRNLIVFLNMFSVSAVICSLSARFVYPQMSLEGHSFWILGLSPISFPRLLWIKFSLAAFFLTLISSSLMYLSTRMLNVSIGLQGIAMFLAASIAIAISGLSIGVGTIFLDLKQRNPAAIVSSFGGTLNLVLSISFTLAVIFPFAILYHLYTRDQMALVFFRYGIVAAIAGVLLLTTLWVYLPIRWGYRSLLKREY